MTAQPWLSGWNYSILRSLFHIVPHRGKVDNFFQFLTVNHLVSTWVLAAAFYLYWRIEDDRTLWRRTRLIQAVLAVMVAVAVTLAFRPWVAWPAPSLNPSFQRLYPYYFWGSGNGNSFPSHSTLVYLIVALGLWPLSRRVSLVLSGFTLAVISLSRVYTGGHYPIDVMFSIGLALVATIALANWRVPARMQACLVGNGSAFLRELLVILWVFELGEEFGGVLDILRGLRHLF